MNIGEKSSHLELKEKADCCGCTSCYAICPVKAISMVEDEKGFLYPSINENECVKCGLCVKKCPIICGNEHRKTSSFYAVKNKQEEVRSVSSSGGIFSAMAQTVIDSGGVVYGAAFDETFAVRHIRTIDESWKKLRTSKYVQSSMGDNFACVKTDLEQGREVLFTATPCQIAGLKKYLDGGNIGRLITVDLVCHGVPSPRVWRDYLEYLSGKTKKHIGKINFRNKTGYGWHSSTLKIESTDGCVLTNQCQSQDFFFRLFFNHLILRPCCYSCQYANLNRVGDITIGDYWGIEQFYPELDDDKGTSLVLVNTPAGEAFFDRISAGCQSVAIKEQECMQPNLKAPAQDFGGVEKFWTLYQKYGLEYAGKQMGYLNKTVWEKIYFLCVRVFDKVSLGKK